MLHRSLHLSPESSDFIRSRIESGRYESPDQLVQAAFRALHREEGEFANKPVRSSIAEEDVFRKLWEASDLLPVDRRKVPRPD